ncbi:tetratricopeptide repeat protein [Spirosoma pulveris]
MKIFFRKNTDIKQGQPNSTERNKRNKQMLTIFGGILTLVLALWLIDNYLNSNAVKAFNSLRDVLLTFLEILALCLLIIIIVTIVRWLIRNPEGIVILPFEIVLVDDKNKLSSYDGKSIADSLTADIITIRNVHKQNQEGSSRLNPLEPEQVNGADNQGNSGSSRQNLPPKFTGKFTTSQFVSSGENLNVGFADIANISVSGNSISIGKVLLTLKKLWNDRDPKYVISGSLQKYGSTTRLVSRLKALGEKDIIISEVHRTIQSEDEIPELIKDLAFNIWQNIPKDWIDISGTESKTWFGLKYFTESLNSYNLFKISGLRIHLEGATTNCLKASQEEIGYKNLYVLASSLGSDMYTLSEFSKAQELFKCATEVAYDAFLPSSDDFKTNAANAHNAFGVCCLSQKNFPDAEFNFRKAIDLMPNTLDGYYNLSIVLSHLNRTEEALDIINDVDKLGIISRDNYNTILGDWLKDLGLGTAAIEKYKIAIEEEPNNVKLYNKCGKIFSYLVKYEEAIDAFKKVLEKEPQYSDEFGNPHNDIGLIYVELGRQEEALEEFNLALHQNPTFAEAHFNLGNLYFNSQPKNETLAITEYEIALQLDPKQMKAYYNLGLVYYSKNEYNKAIINFQQAIAIGMSTEDCYNQLANAFFNLDEFDNAEIQYKKALALNQDNFDAHSGLGYLYRLKEDYPKAVLAFRHATRLDKRNSEIFRGTGEIFRKLKSWDEAIWTYQQAIEIDDKDPYGHICLAHCHLAKEQMELYAKQMKSAELLRQQWEPNDYTLACYEALNGNLPMAVASLRTVLEKKMQTIKYINLDIDFESIRNEPEFKRLIEEYISYY